MEPGVLALLIPILAIVMAAAVVLSRIWIRHRERMALIEAGFHPDHPELYAEDEERDPPRLPERSRSSGRDAGR
jgi:hypothetical protein